jgi:hypothetical protein
VPQRVDNAPGHAVVITEEIVVGILESHIFLADVTLRCSPLSRQFFGWY